MVAFNKKHCSRDVDRMTLRKKSAMTPVLRLKSFRDVRRRRRTRLSVLVALLFKCLRSLLVAT